jgi:hypothetical protein
MARGDAVLGPAGGHAHEFQRAEVGGKKGETADPRGNRVAREKEVGAGLHRALERKADGDHEADVNQHDRVVDGMEMHKVNRN